MPIFIPLFRRIFAHFEKWILTLKIYNSKTTQPNLKNYTSKSKLDYPLSNKSIFIVIQEFIWSHEADKRPKFLLDHPVSLLVFRMLYLVFCIITPMFLWNERSYFNFRSNSLLFRCDLSFVRIQHDNWTKHYAMQGNRRKSMARHLFSG